MLYEVITPIFAAMISGSALADVMRPSFSVLQLSPVAPHMGGEHWANPKDMPRITSYNVCYTKLLRETLYSQELEAPKQCAFMVQQDQYLAGRPFEVAPATFVSEKSKANKLKKLFRNRLIRNNFV